MADRYWVGGTGTWDATTTHWSTTSGGAGGASVPTTADNVIFDTLSSATGYTVTVSGSRSCLSLTASAPLTGNLTLAGTGALTIAANLTLYSGMVWTLTGGITFTSTSTGRTIETNGTSLTCDLNFNGAGGEWSLQSDTTTSADILLTRGTLKLNGSTLFAKSFSSSNTNTRKLDLTGSTFDLTAPGNTTIWNTATTTNLTVTKTTSAVSLTSTANTSASRQFPCQANFGSITLETVYFKSSGYAYLYLASNLTAEGVVDFSGTNESSGRLFIGSTVRGTTRTITGNSSYSIFYTDFEDITLAGSAAPGSGTSVGDCGGNSDITFTAATTRYWVGNGGNFTDTSHWSASSGGAGGASFPLPQDTALFDAASFSSASQSVVVDVEQFRFGKIDCAGVDSNPAINIARDIWFYGDVLFNDSHTLSGVQSLNLAGRGSYVVTRGTANTIHGWLIDAPSGTYTLQGDWGNSGGGDLTTLTLTRGTFDANDYDLHLNRVLGSGTLARSLLMGSGRWRLVYALDSWQFGTITNLTFDAELSTIEINSAGGVSHTTFAGGGLTYHNLEINRTAGGTGAVRIEDSNTFDTLSHPGAPPRTVLFEAGTTQTINVDFDVSGTAGNLITIGSITAANHSLVFNGAGIINSDYLSISRSQASPADTWYAGDNSTDNGNNSGWLFEAASTDYSEGVSETVTFAENLASLLEANSASEESFDYSDDLASLSAYNPDVSEDNSYSEALNGFKSAGVTVVELATLEEVLGSLLAANANASATTTLEEVLGSLLAANANASETTTLEEIVNALASFSANVEDSLTVTEFLRLLRGMVLRLTNERVTLQLTARNVTLKQVGEE